MNLKNFVILLNVICIAFVAYNLNKHGIPNGDDFYWVMAITLAPILTIYYLFTNQVNNEDNIFSLWLEVRRKKLKDELKK